MSLDEPNLFLDQIAHLGIFNNCHPIILLGGRHIIYGVRPEDYMEFSSVLAKTIAKFVTLILFS